MPDSRSLCLPQTVTPQPQYSAVLEHFSHAVLRHIHILMQKHTYMLNNKHCELVLD